MPSPRRWLRRSRPSRPMRTGPSVPTESPLPYRRRLAMYRTQVSEPGTSAPSAQQATGVAGSVNLHHDIHLHLPPVLRRVCVSSDLPSASRGTSMSHDGAIRDWLFKGMAVEDLLDNLELEGLPVRAAEDPGAVQRVLPLEDFSPAIRRTAVQALPAYLALFCLENSVRELVVERMQDGLGVDWWGIGTSSELRKEGGTAAREGGGESMAHSPWRAGDLLHRLRRPDQYHPQKLGSLRRSLP